MPRDQSKDGKWGDGKTTTVRNPGQFPFQEAVRRQAKLRIAIDGPSGSGKTHSALLLALGLVDHRPLRDDESKRIAVLDTEKKSASMEAGKPGIPPFDTAPLGPPYTPQRYVQLIKIAEQHYDVLIIDSLSHAWSAEGGILETVDQKQASQKNKFAAWRDVTPMHNALVEALLQADCHIIACIRTKTAWDFEEVDGKKKPVKIGLKLEQREAIEYEFTLVFDLSLVKHVATPSKDRTSLFDTPMDKRSMALTPAHGKELADWMNSGAEPAPPPAAPADAPKNGKPKNGIKEITRLYQKGLDAGVPIEQWSDWLVYCEIQKDPETHKPFRLKVLEEKIDDWIHKMENPDPVPFPDDDKPDFKDTLPPADPTPPDPKDEAPPDESGEQKEFFEDPAVEAAEDDVLALYDLAKKHAGISTARDFYLFCRGLTGNSPAQREHSGLPVLTNSQVAMVTQRMQTMAGSSTVRKTNQELDLGTEKEGGQ